jgi:cyclophilin family peptidyl-prolyl cis-trans isomerase
MKKISIVVILLISIVGSGLAQTKKPADPKKTSTKSTSKKAAPEPKHTLVYGNNVPKEQQQMVEISTSYGVMVVKLYNETPLHRDNFIKLVRQGFYDSLLFHRIIKSFMIQGGDPLSKHADSNAMLGSGDNGNKIPPEFNAELFHKRGALAAARDNNPQKMSSGCQFYIVQGRRYSAQELEQIINSRNLARKQELLYQCYQSDSVQATVSAFQNMGDKEQTRLYMERIQLAVDKMYKEMYPDATVINENQVQTYIEYGGAPHLDGSYTVFGELVSGWDVLDKIAMVQTKPGDRPAVDVRMKMRLL